jgi:hypothetical protein
VGSDAVDPGARSSPVRLPEPLRPSLPDFCWDLIESLFSEPNSNEMWTISGPFDGEKPESKDPVVVAAAYAFSSPSATIPVWCSALRMVTRDEAVANKSKL